MGALEACRVCLASDRDMYPLASTGLQETYERVTTSTLVLAGRPCCVCWVCLAALRRCRRLIDTAREANDALQRWHDNRHSKLVEQPLCSLTQTQPEIIDISGVDNLEAGVKLERDATDNISIRSGNLKNENLLEDNILTMAIKFEVTGDNDNNDTQPVDSLDYESDNTHDSDDKSIKTQMLDNIKSNNSQALPHFECVDVYEEMTDTENGSKMSDNVRPDILEECNVGDETAGTLNAGKKDPMSSQAFVFQRPTKRNAIQNSESGPTLKRKTPITSEQLSENTDPAPVLHRDKDVLMYLCPKCNYKTPEFSFLMNHVVNHSVENRYSCDNCTFKSNRKSILIQHLKSHSEPEPFVCDFKCKYKVNLSLHERTHNGEKLFFSNIEENKCAAQSDLKKHLTLTHEKLINNDKCAFKSTQKPNLKQHLKVKTGIKPFKCDNCDFKSFNNKTRLIEHLNTHNGVKAFTCDYCDFRSNYKSNLRQHQSIHTGEKRFSCDKCEYRCNANRDLKKHLKIHTGEKPFVCHICAHMYKFKHNLIEHLRTHTGEKPFACDQCDFRSNLKTGIKLHVMNHHTKNKPYACDKCDFKSALKCSLKSHLLTHSEEKPFVCNMCKFRSNTKANLQVHMLIHNEEKRFACDKCDYKGRLGSQLKQHNLTHIAPGKKPFSCNYCDYKCIRKISLVNHLSKHTGYNPFLCDKCDYKCAVKSQFKIHLLNHSGHKKFACDYCGYWCNSKHNLKNHIRIHTGEKPFACDKCSFKCNQQQSLKRHLKTHTGEKPFACDKCDYKSTNKQGLDKHKCSRF